MKSIFASIVTTLVLLMAVTANAASGVCTLDLSKLRFEETSIGKRIIGEPLETKTISVQIPADAGPYDYFNLTGTIGEFEIFAMVEPGEQRVSNIIVSDRTHMIELTNDQNLVSLSNMQSMQRVTVYCKYEQ
ncbi:hypothetical protein [Bdellovibrio sp. HCB337]|uniref:hypothetical protein n=1 Tax=Bdellovibrio sp. HCB337 TaxID=3394358 RepID=UPI0039A58A43